ncbi:hypothetical protein HDK77DRAFT_496055 [Phyllosticta capitalensis]
MHLDGIGVWIEARDNAKDAVYEEFIEKEEEEPPEEKPPEPRFPLGERFPLPEEIHNLQELLERYRVWLAEQGQAKEDTPHFEPHKSTCYIEARTGTMFKIKIRIMKSFDMHNAAALRLYITIDNEWEFGYSACVTKKELERAQDGGSMVGEVLFDVDYDNGNKYEMRFEKVEESKGKGKGRAHSSEPLHVDVENLITVIAQRVARIPDDEICVLPTRSPALHASRMARYLEEHRVVSQYVKPCLAGRLEKGFEIPWENWKPLGFDAWKQDPSIWWDPTGDKQAGRPYIFEFRYRSQEQLQALDLVSMRYDANDGRKNDSEQNKGGEEKDDSNKENEAPTAGDNNYDPAEDQDDSVASSESSLEEHELPPVASAFGTPNAEGYLVERDEIITATRAIALSSGQARVFELESQDPGVIVFFQHDLDQDEESEGQRAIAQIRRERYLTNAGDILTLTLAIAAVSSEMGIEGTLDGFQVYYECSVEAKRHVMRMTGM